MKRIMVLVIGCLLFAGWVARAEELLDVGSSGPTVAAIQQALYIGGYLSEAPDGVFGEKTRRAAQTYMEANAEAFAARLSADAEEPSAVYPEDGGMPYVVDVRLTTAEAVRTDGRIDADWLEYILSGAMPEGGTLAQGDRGGEVRRMQTRLLALGYLAAGTDGVFGRNTALALRYFQRRSGLPETGEFDGATRALLYSEDAAESDQYVSPYKALVSTSKNRVRFLRWTGAGYDEIARECVCTTGAKATPTIKGTFQAAGQAGEWYHMKASNCWVRYAFRIEGGYMFHSVLFNSRESSKPTGSSVRNLGKNASHGCIRMAVEDVKWIYENCAPGMTVAIE